MILAQRLPKYMRLPLILLIPALILSACTITLADDIAPPPGYQQEMVTNIPQQAAAAGPVYPLVAPDPAAGEVIYLDKCAPCHGVEGQGNGPRAPELPNPTTPFSSSAVSRAASPSDWYDVVTRGNINRYMPPFPSLSERQRWDVVAYIRTLSSSPASVELGREVYEANCAACHGDDGRGRGVQSASLSRPLPDFSLQPYMVEKSPQEFFTLVSAGVPPEMPPFHSTLQEGEIWAVSEYLHTFAYASAARLASEPEPASQTPAQEQSGGVVDEEIEEEESEGEETEGEEPAGDQPGQITGTVINASGGDPIAGAEVTLHGFDGMQLSVTDTVLTEQDGSFVFENVEVIHGRVFLATVEYSNATYASSIVTSDVNTTSISLEINAFETTTDHSALVIDRLHIFFDYTDPGVVQVIELYIISNPGRKTVVGEELGAPVVTFLLPEGAANLQFQDGELGSRYIPVPGGFADTTPVRPTMGEYQVLFGYELPYERQLELVHPINIPVEAVIILQPNDGVRLRSDLLADQGVRDVQGVSYQMYSGGPFPAGSSVTFTLSGRPGGGLVSFGSLDTLVIGLGAFGVVLITAGVLMYRRNQFSQAEVDEEADEPVPFEEEDRESLVDAIIALDDQYQAGELPEDAYRARRAELKLKLKEISDQSQG
jgi:cbb3-type cytochrome c oxidase subunit III